MKNETSLNNSIFDPIGYKPVSVGSRVREIRHERGLSIRDLAEESGLAVNTLSLIENEKSSPSVKTLKQIAQALQIPLVSLFESVDSDRKPIYTNVGNRREVNLEGLTVEDCGVNLNQQQLQPLIVTLSPGYNNQDTPVLHRGTEFIYVLSGQLHYHVANNDYVINKGDSLLFNANLQHYWENRSDITTVYLLVMAPEQKYDMPSEVHFSGQ